MTPSAQKFTVELRALENCFSGDEIDKLDAALGLIPTLREETREELAGTFAQASRSLPLVAEAIKAAPSVYKRQQVGQRSRDPETLVDRLCHTEGASIEFSIPTSALLGRSFLLAKVNFLKALRYSLEGAGAEVEAAVDALKDLMGEAVFSKLVEELLTALVANPLNPMDLRRVAARKLIHMWEDGISLPVSKLPSVLISAWRARGKVRAIYGTLIGVNEIFSLVQAQCQSRFLNYFVRDHVTADEREAFREFLFAISHEDLQKLQAYMSTHDLKAISPEKVQEIISTPQHPVLLDDPSPEQMYNSYCRRRIRADYRVLSDSPGPHKTAEGYMMEALLREAATEGNAEE